MNLTIVYMVAGLSSRFGGKIKSFTKVGPKGETLIEYSVNQAIKAGFNKIIFVVGEHTEKPFKKKFGNNYKGIPVEYALQKYDKEKRDKPWGTCDAVCCTIETIHEPFVVATGDDLYSEKTFEDLVNHLKTSEDDATIGMDLIEMFPKNKRAVSRGLFKIDNEDYVIDGEESTGISRENFKERGFNEKTPVSMSIFGLHQNTLQLLNEKLKIFRKQNSEDRKVECFLNETLISLIKENKIKMKLYPFSGKWLGITNPEDEIKVREELKKIN